LSQADRSVHVDTRQAESGCDRWVEALVDCPAAQGLFTYSLPADLRVEAGDILSVNFGAVQVGAIAIRVLEQPPDFDPAKIRPILEVISPGFFPPGYC
jgi:primosomal protein N' (replication factor Y) (superfamily II helicase)